MKRLVSALGSLGVLLVIAAVVLRFVKPDMPQWYQRLALAGLVVMVLYSLSQWRDIKRSFEGKNVKYGSMAASGVLLVLGILIGVNWIGVRQHKRWDLTAGGTFSLSDQTKKIVSELKQPLVMRAFYTRGAEEYRDKLGEYAYLSKQVTVDYVDAERTPLEAQKFEITTVPTIVLEYGGRTERASSLDEQAITNALKKVIEGKPKKAYFVQGHGEHDPTGSEPDGYSGITEGMKTDNFDVAPVTLAQAGKVPDDATVVVIAGPKTDLLAPELDALKAFLAKGGKVALLLDPPEKGVGADTPNLIALAHEWGVDVGKDLIVDASGLGQLIGTNAATPVAMPVRHAITDNFGIMTAFPLARSINPVEGGVGGHTAQKVLQTSDQSWAESDVKGLYATGKPSRDLGAGDKAGPIAIAVAVSAPVTEPTPATATPPAADAPKPETRVVIVGDSDFISNRAVGLQGNREIFLNMANWLAQQEDMIAIRPKSPEDRPLTMTADQQGRVWWFTQIIVPLLLFGMAVRIYWKRR